MSIAIIIEWRDSDPEVYEFAFTSTVQDTWVPLAKSAHHRWMTDLADYIVVTPGNIDDILKEAKELQVLLESTGNLNHGSAIQKLIEPLERLKLLSGWQASIGS